MVVTISPPYLALSAIYFKEGYGVLSVYFIARWVRQVALGLENINTKHKK